MPIHSIHLPDAVISEVARRAGMIFGADAPVALAVALQAFPAHEIYVTDLGQCAAGTAVQGARHAGWRIIVTPRGAPAKSVEIGLDADGNARFDGVNEGPYVGATLDALKAAPLLVSDDRDYVVRMLKAPSMYLAALWLHNAEEAERGLILALPPTPPDVAVGKIEPVQNFERLLQPPAQIRLGRARDNLLGG